MAFVVFEPRGGKFQAFLSLEEVVSAEADPEVLANRAAAVYERWVGTMLSTLDGIRSRRIRRKIVSARMVWEIGNAVFELKADLSGLGLEIDGLYEHLARDLVVKRKWLEKAVILRRYVADVTVIAESVSWGSCEKGTRRAAERLARGLPPR